MKKQERSSFTEKVLALTRKIPKGKVTTYKIIAKKLNSKAYRAVGTALKNNKTPIKVPCHRVINSDGKIGFYKGKPNSKEISKRSFENLSDKVSDKKIKLLKKEGIEIKDNKVKNLRNFLYK